MTLDIAQMPVMDRPRERLKRLGSEALAADELLAVILGSGSRKEPVLKLSKQLLVEFGSLQALAEASLEEMQDIPGIGLAKALKLKAAFSLARRCDDMKMSNEKRIKSPKQVFQAVLPFVRNEKKELFLMVLLDVKLGLIGVELVSTGTLTSTLVHPREVFYTAIKRKAHAWVAVHNHPSGSLEPSPEDFRLTEQLIQASEIVCIPLLDHLIVSHEGFCSLRSQGINFSHCKKMECYG